MTETEIDERARQMSDDERDAYLAACGWQNVGAGWIPPDATTDQGVWTSPSGLYSRSSAIHEQLAREDPDAVPNELGRHYHGSQPKNSTGKRW